jgi:hypothetical protein
MKVKSDEYVAIRDAMGTVQGREAGFIQAVLPNRNAYLIGFADTGLKQAFTNLNWVVIASEEEGELFGTVRTVAHFAMVLLVLAVLMLAVLTAYIFLHRAQRMTDIESPPEEKTKSAAA